MAPIYARIAIDTANKEFHLARKLYLMFWDNKVKLVTECSSEAKITNQKIWKIKTDLEVILWFLQFKQSHITPITLKNVYMGLTLKVKVPLAKPTAKKHIKNEANFKCVCE